MALTELFQACHGSMLSTVKNIVILQYIDAVGWGTGKASGLKKICCNNSQKCTFLEHPSLEVTITMSQTLSTFRQQLKTRKSYPDLIIWTSILYTDN